MSRRRGIAGPLIGRLAVGALIGASAWISVGVLALVEPARLTRVGAVPGWTWLAGLVGVGAVLGALVRVPATAWPPLVLLPLLWLPWLPFPVPAVFLMWEGPLEIAVWLGALGGVAWLSHDPRGVFRRWLAIPPSRAPWMAALAAALLFTASWAIVQPRVPVGDEPHYLVITQSLLGDGDLRIENNHLDDQYLEYFDGALKPDFMRRGTDLQIYSIHAPGLPVVVAPAFLLAGYPGAAATVAVLTALGLALAWRAAFLVTGSSEAAWVGWLALATAAPVVLHGFTIYPDGLGATAAMAGVVALVSLDVWPDRRQGAWYWLGTGAAVALLPWLHTRFALVAAALGVAVSLRLVGRPGGWRDAARFLTVPLLAAAAWFSYFWLIYGTPNPAAPYGSRPEGGLAFVPRGLAGLLVDQQFGLAVNAPVLLAALAAFAPLARRRPRLTGELLCAVLPYLTTVASYPMWWGGYSAPARFAVIVLPMLAVPLAVAWTTAPIGRAILGALLALSATVTAALVGLDRGAFIYNGRDGYSVLLDWASRTVDLTLALPSVHRDGAAAAVGDFAVWCTAGVLLAGVTALAARLVRPSAARAVAWTAMPAALMLSVAVTWAGRDRDVLTTPTSQMAFLERWVPARAPLTVQLSPMRRVAQADVPRRLTLGTSLRGPLRPAGDPLLQIPALPAGDYDVFVDGSSRLAGTALVRLGRQDVPMETWQLGGRPTGFTGLVLRLPVDAHSITVVGDAGARQTVRRLTLKPRALAPRGVSASALRAGRYGGVVLFALDDNAYLEPGAQWVRGERATAMVVMGDAGVRPVVRLRAGAVDNVVTLSAGAWHARVPLPKDTSADVALPGEALAPAALTIASATGFRPSEQMPGNGDVRWLGVHLTWPGGEAALPR